ncbi:hypothetical protein NUU61_010035 [Penicillium alfredii]|uniref:Probable glucan endo-1,3-beta-glucosidase eglC n=1 Tax=Penicillium alfredii TaxID=1506179 RepID=A0A9W9EH96_9EURO|nr:uncharacterized protein NUU61_010035 [Penicillium alfredii]KAJ5081771.1 hypothetical protein NUU61_010035 [Penicillium alfredii]
MHLTRLVAFALSLATSEAVHQGFNYGNMKPDGSAKAQADFKAEFATAKGLKGVKDFNSARLYTMIQGGTTNTPISAIPAAIEEKTTLLLGLWASGDGMQNEVAALKSAINQYGDDFAKLVVGISVGSEDLYRNSVEGAQANAGIGINPHDLAEFIDQVRDTIKGTPLSGASIGHVDTWTAWTNDSNAEVVEKVDWLGFDGYPYFQGTMDNSIDDGKKLFDEAVAKTKSAAGKKEVWITETGWPVGGKTVNKAVASKENAKRFWDEVGCPLFGNTNTWWYTLQDGQGESIPNPSFGIVGNKLSTTPLFDLSCSSSKSSRSSESGSSADSASGSGSSASASAPAQSGSTTASGTVSSSSAAATSQGFMSATKPQWSPIKGAALPRVSPSGSAAASNAPAATGAPGSSSGSSGSGSGSSGSGSSTDSSSAGGASPSQSAPNSAGRVSGSIFGAVVAAFAVAVAL